MAGSISSRMYLLYMGISPIWFLLIVENSNLTQIVILGKGSLQITVWQLGSVSLQGPFGRILTNNANKWGDPSGWDWMSAPFSWAFPPLPPGFSGRMLLRFFSSCLPLAGCLAFSSSPTPAALGESAMNRNMMYLIQTENILTLLKQDKIFKSIIIEKSAHLL